MTETLEVLGLRLAGSDSASPLTVAGAAAGSAGAAASVLGASCQNICTISPGIWERVSERIASRLWLTATYAKSHIGAIRFDRRLGSHDRGSGSEGDLQGLLEVRHADVRDRACVERVRRVRSSKRRRAKRTVDLSLTAWACARTQRRVRDRVVMPGLALEHGPVEELDKELGGGLHVGRGILGVAVMWRLGVGGGHFFLRGGWGWGRGAKRPR